MIVAHQSSLPEPLTLIHVDGPLFERVLINLLRRGEICGGRSQIGIDAHVEGENRQLDVSDNGPGLPRPEQTILNKVARGDEESGVPGVGLGLAIVGR
ncbi:ATP-binding protein [Shigella sonnei]